MKKDCTTCACNKVCSHDIWDVENCQNWIHHLALDPNQQEMVYYPKLSAALSLGDYPTVQAVAREAVQQYCNLLAGAINGQPQNDVIFAAVAACGLNRAIEGQLSDLHLQVKKKLEKDMITICIDPTTHS